MYGKVFRWLQLMAGAQFGKAVQVKSVIFVFTCAVIIINDRVSCCALKKAVCSNHVNELSHSC